jgi:16S rRNA (cytosine967-C5)-methyltransferase
VALEVLRAVRRGAFADRAFERTADSLDEPDRRLAQELAYGVLRLQARLDHLLGQLVDGGLGRIEPDLLDTLRVGAYQLLELERVPAYAAVSEAVEAAKQRSGRGAASLANAVLRRLGPESYASYSFPSFDDDPAGYLATWGSHPRWLLERWLGRWPADEVKRLTDYNNSRPAVYFTVAGHRDNAIESLRAAGIEAEPVRLSPSSVRIGTGRLARALEAVEAVVQDPAATAVVDYMALDPGTPVVDLCAAPGGKAVALAARGHEVWAFDVSRARLERLLENRERLGMSRLHAAVADSTRPPVASAPVVLLDAPCTGTGTLARHPDGRWRLGPGDLEKLVVLQKRLLDAAAGLVEPGGWLVYATCSLEPEENEGQVSDFLKRHADFESDRPVGAGVSEDLLGASGELQVLPQRHDMDGAYAARLRRRSG